MLSLAESFETGADEPENVAGLAGNFDGQGISFGALQWKEILMQFRDAPLSSLFPPDELAQLQESAKQDQIIVLYKDETIV